METQNEVVNDDLTNQQPSDGTTPEEAVKEETVTPAQAGDKTPANELLSQLQTEREKRRMLAEKNKLLEEELKSLKFSPPLDNGDEDLLSEEGKIFKREITEVKSELYSIKESKEKDNILATYPILKEKETEFDDYRALPENKGMSIATAAKAFLAENSLLPSHRRGLEKTTGGEKAVPKYGMTTDEVKKLRESNYREYQKLLSEDKIKIIEV